MDRILCATADDDVTDLLRYPLARAGFEVRMCHTGRDALRIMRTEGLVLIILDDDFPDMSGLEVLSALRAFSQVPVVMLVARSQEEPISAGPGQGADAYMAKPFSAQVLVERVRAVLHRAGDS